MDRSGHTTVYLPEVSLHQHGVLAQMGLTVNDIRVHDDGSLCCVRRNGQRNGQFIARTRTHMGLAVIVTFSCKAGGESDLLFAIETLLFSLAVASTRIHRSAMGLVMDRLQLTVFCNKRVQAIITREVCYAAEFGYLVAFAPIAFQYKRITKSSKLGSFESAFDAAAAAAIASREHMHYHAIDTESHTETGGEKDSTRVRLAPHVRDMLRDAHKASAAQYHGFWSSISIE